MTLMELAVKAVKKKTKYKADLRITATVKFRGPRRVLSKMAVPFVDKLILKSKNIKAMRLDSFEGLCLSTCVRLMNVVQ